MGNIKFSIVVLAYNSELGIGECINSIINQTLSFKDNVEIILINDGSKDNVCNEFAAAYPDNITCISTKHEGIGSSRNLGIKNSKGDYIHFLDGDDCLSENALKNVYDLFEKHDSIDFVSIPTVSAETEPNHPNFALKYGTSREVNLLENPEFIQVQSNSCFFKRETIKNVDFSPEYNVSQDVSFVNTLLIDNPNMGVCNGCAYYKRKHVDHDAFGVSSNGINYSLKSLVENSVKKYGEVPKFIQNTLLYYLNEIIDEEDSEDEIEILNREIKSLIVHIDDESIYDNEYLDIEIKTFLIFLKHDNSYPEKDQIKLTKCLNLDTVFIDIYEIIDDTLHVLANINSIAEDEDVGVYINNEKIETKPLEFPQREKYCLNQKYLTNHTFEFYYKLDKNKKYELEFKSELGKSLKIDFSRPCNFSKVVGYAKTRKYLSKLNSNRILISKYKTSQWLILESKTLINMLKNRVPGFKTSIPIRMAYMALYPFYRNKRIWIYMDFPTIADDNGMHLFRYSINQNEKGIKKYFIIDKNSPDYDKMKKIGPVIPYHSIKHRVLGLFTEKIITSHPDNNYIYAFWGHYPNFTGILKSSTIFIQHGITLNNISSWLNKYDKNLDFILTASKKEYESLLRYYYNYDEEIMHLLGFPRFDNLKDEKTKTILLMPTWRRYLDHENEHGISNSSYFKTYNSLINNEKLMKIAEKYGYKIIFRPHPHVYKYIDLFDENDTVIIDHERGSYQDLFKKGALMITDYSSVAFDFAYLKKPVLYFQYGEDFHFNLEESYFDYDTMGFGEVCKNEDELIDILEEYMKNDCKMKEKHVKNVEDYFIFTDKNNCRRVHEAILKIPPRD